MTTKIDASHAQDAFHYALAAAGGCLDGYESAFSGFRSNPGCKNAIEFYRASLKRCTQAGLVVPAALSRPALSVKATEERATRLTRWIRCACEKDGVDANQGETIAFVATEELKWSDVRSTAEYLLKRYPEFFAGHTVETITGILTSTAQNGLHLVK